MLKMAQLDLVKQTGCDASETLTPPDMGGDADLAKIKARELSRMILSGGEYRAKITVHMGTCGIAAGAREIMLAFLDEIEKNKVQDVIVTTSGCAGPSATTCCPS